MYAYEKKHKAKKGKEANNELALKVTKYIYSSIFMSIYISYICSTFTVFYFICDFTDSD